jgi:hypothetical protein
MGNKLIGECSFSLGGYQAVNQETAFAIFLYTSVCN